MKKNERRKMKRKRRRGELKLQDEEGREVAEDVGRSRRNELS